MSAGECRAGLHLGKPGRRERRKVEGRELPVRLTARMTDRAEASAEYERRDCCSIGAGGLRLAPQTLVAQAAADPRHEVRMNGRKLHSATAGRKSGVWPDSDSFWAGVEAAYYWRRFLVALAAYAGTLIRWGSR
jgi:hypothetical protein